LPLIYSCNNQPKEEEVINETELESQIIEQSFPLLLNEIVIRPYGFEPNDGETISNYDERLNKLNDEFKSNVVKPEMVISDQLFIPENEDINKYRRTIDWDLFTFLTSDSIEKKIVNISSLRKHKKLKIIDSYPRNLVKQNEVNLSFIGGCWYSRILFKKQHTEAKFIFFFDGGYWQTQEFKVNMKKTKNEWIIVSVKEI